MGRIFEQSVTELELLAADADGRLSLSRVAKRKRHGVYYTPESVVGKIVEETVGTVSPICEGMPSGTRVGH